MKRSNSVKRAARITKRGNSYDNILSSVANLLSAIKTTKEYTGSILQAILPLSSDTSGGAFIHMGGKISDSPDLKKRTITLEIERRWGKDIIEEGAKKIALVRGGPRMEQRW